MVQTTVVTGVCSGGWCCEKATPKNKIVQTPPGQSNRQNSNDFRGEEHTKNANDINDIQEIPSVVSELDSVVDP